MPVSPAALLDRVTGGRGALALRYSMVSVVGVVLTQLELLLFVGILDLQPTWSNAVAVSLCSIPVFILNKRWVWSRDGKIDLRREILPFWAFTIAGLVISTILVAVVQRWSDATLLVMAANLTGFGILWVAKFLFLDQVMFGRPELDEVLAQETDTAVGPA